VGSRVPRRRIEEKEFKRDGEGGWARGVWARESREVREYVREEERDGMLRGWVSNFLS